MYNSAADSVASPTNSTSSGHSDISSVSAWWGSGDISVSSDTTSSVASVSSGSSAFSIGSANERAVGSFGQAQVHVREIPRMGNTRMILRHPQVRPPHNPARYAALSTQHVYAAPQRTPMLARVSIVDYRGNVLYDTFVRPTNQIEDFRTSVTGLAAEQLFSAGAMALSAVTEQVSSLIRGKIIIGHSLWIHLSLLGITHPAIDTRDVALYLPFHRSITSSTVTPLKSLVSHLMRRKIGRTYEHPLEEARAALDLFRSYEDPWEDEIREGAWPCALPPSAFSRLFS